ncbi:MAG: trehalose-phosphatase [Sphingomonas bacterium]|nr:trehalose-phosphatase [Sphingomonas bacterium]
MQQDLSPPPLSLLADAALFLDFDGTLVDLADTPDAVMVDSALAAIVARLAARLDGRIAIVSGRPVDEIQSLFGQRQLIISGSHGLEIALPDGTRHDAERPAVLDRIIAEMDAFAADKPGLLVETKPLGAALHYRRAPDYAGNSIALATRLAGETGLHLQTGKMMIEIRVPGADKGTAIDRLMTMTAMTGHRPVFLGDDDTDEPAMIAATAHGGCGILIGEPRDTAAAWRLPSVAAARQWLTRAVEEVAA